MFATVVAGVFVFVTCQCVLKLSLDPLVSLKSNFGELIEFFLFHQTGITTANVASEDVKELRAINARILSNSRSIACYPFIRILSFNRLPKPEEIVESCQNINWIIYHLEANHPDINHPSQLGGMKEKNSLQACDQIEKSMTAISDMLKLNLKFSTVSDPSVMKSS